MPYDRNQMLLEQVGSLKEELNGFKEAARLVDSKQIKFSYYITCMHIIIE